VDRRERAGRKPVESLDGLHNSVHSSQTARTYSNRNILDRDSSACETSEEDGLA